MHPLAQFRWVAIVEGWSYLILLFVAMPLKYLADQPWAVKITGSAHGALFVLFCLALLQVFLRCRWSLKQAFWAFVASLIPFATFVLERRLKAMLQAEQDTLLTGESA